MNIFVDLDSTPLNIICGYRPPTTPVCFWEKMIDFTDTVHSASPAATHTFIIGDFNVDVLNNKHTHYNHLKSLCNTAGLENAINSTTRLPSQTILDLILVPTALLNPTISLSTRNKDVSLNYTKVNPCDVSDHQPIMVSLQCVSKKIVRPAS
eukprot:scpid102373/ scgid12536/ 